MPAAGLTCPSPLGLKCVGGTCALFCTGMPPLIEGFTGNVSTILPNDDAAVDVCSTPANPTSTPTILINCFETVNINS